MYRIARLTAPSSSHKNFNVKLYHFVHAAAAAANANAGSSTIALPVHLYRRANNVQTGGQTVAILTLMPSLHHVHTHGQPRWYG